MTGLLTTRAPRIAIIVPYWEFWERSARVDLLAHVRDVATHASSALVDIEVVSIQVLTAESDSNAVAERIRALAPDVLVVLQLMAVPPARTSALLERLSDLPLVVWGLNLRRHVPTDYDHAEITTEGATVGVTQLVSMLTRTSRPYALCIGPEGDRALIEALERSLRAAWTARRISMGTLARVGSEPPGYDCVVCDHSELESALGLKVIEIPPSEIVRRFHEVDRPALALVQAETNDTFELSCVAPPTAEGLERSLRFAVALAGLDQDWSIDAGAINCHIPELRFASDVGIAPCFALGRETTRGTPWACAGDMLTAVALLTTKLLGAAAVYHELEAIDYEADEVVIANTGEHDLAWADPQVRPVLRSNGWFSSDVVCGACACFSPPAGPATLVAFVPHPQEPSGFRYITAEGEFGERTFPLSGTINASFRFRERTSIDGFTAWACAGANHHSSSTPGLLANSVALVAAYLRVGCVQVS